MPRRKRKLQATPKPEDLDLVTGRWKVVEVVYEPEITDGAVFTEGLEIEPLALTGPEFTGVEVVLDDQCDVVWHVPAEVDCIPLLQTTSFFIEGNQIDLLGAPEGKSFSFDIDGDQQELQLSSSTKDLDGTMTIKIIKIKHTVETASASFSLKDALDEGFFPDLSLRSSDGHQFHVHRTVLASCCPGMRYRDWEMVLSTLKTPLLKATLCYIYTDDVPSDMTVALAKELYAVASGNPKLAILSQLCKTFLDKHNLKLRLVQLVDDIQSSLEVGRKIVDSADMTNPVKVTYSVKQMAKEAAVVATKFCLLCELYTRNKNEMSKAEKQEVLEYVRGRVLVFIDHTRELLELVLAKWNSLGDQQKTEMAHYIMPEVERIWDMVLASCKEIQTVMATKRASMTPMKVFQRGELKLVLQFMSKRKELRRLEKINKEFEDFVVVAESKREDWKEWSEEERAEKICRAIEHLVADGENQLDNFEDIKKEILLENALDWKQYKMFVAVACSYVSWGLRKLLTFKDTFTPVLLRACKFLQHNEVNQTLVYFNLLEEKDIPPDEGTRAATVEGGGTPSAAMPVLEHRLVEGSHLARGCQQLLETWEFSDMQFILPAAMVVEGGGSEVVIPAHRVIVAARCEWFKKALLSGMKEAIDKRIVIPDVEESVFRTYLQFLYGCTLDVAAMSMEELMDLLAVADKYETPSLRLLCESQLVGKVADSTVFLLLQVADRYSACRKLKEAALQHILQNTDVIMEDVDGYSNLSEDLKQELRALSGTRDPTLLLRHAQPKTDSDKEKEKVYDNVGNQIQPPMTYTALAARSSSTSSSDGGGSEDEYLLQSGTAVFEAAVVELRGIVGDDASDELLRDLLLAADCDVNRAANYFFNTQGV